MHMMGLQGFRKAPRRPLAIGLAVLAAVGLAGCAGGRQAVPPPSVPLQAHAPAAFETRPPSQPQPQGVRLRSDEPVVHPPAVTCVAGPGYDRRGTASWYGESLHGQPTASGETFDMNGLTAAHRTLAFGTEVRVTNLKNGRAVILTINDRGPFTDGRLIDVSRRAAEELDFLGDDLAPVRVEELRGC